MQEENDMPVILEETKEQLHICSKCAELMNHGKDAIPGYQYGCKLLAGSAFNMIPDETIEKNAVFSDCPKLDGTVFEGNRYWDVKKGLKQ